MGLETITKTSGPIDRISISQRAKEISSQLPPINSQCQAAAVIPVCREFEGGRIMELVKELSSQSVGQNHFEAILVVNNPLTKDSLAVKSVEDNLKFLVHIDEQKRNGYFPNIHVLDCTNGDLPGRHMGFARGLGQLVAEDRLYKTERGGKGVIIQLDADVSITSGFVSELLGAYKNIDINSAMIGRIPLPIDFLSDDYYLHYAARFSKYVINNLVQINRFAADGATLSFRAFTHRVPEVREYIRMPVNEDFRLGEELSKFGKMYLLAEPRVYKADRIRPDGFDSGNRDTAVKPSIDWEAIDLLISYVFGKRYTFQGMRDIFTQSEFWKKVRIKLGEKDRDTEKKLNFYLSREEQLARVTMDWDNLDINMRDLGLNLYAFSRMAIGEDQIMPLKWNLGYQYKNNKSIYEWSSRIFSI